MSYFLRTTDDRNQAKIAKRAADNLRMDSVNYFEEQKRKNKETFNNAIEIFKNRDAGRRRGQVEFILVSTFALSFKHFKESVVQLIFQAALNNMEAFGVHRDLDTYRALVDIMPKGKYVPQNSIQTQYGHYVKQQECVITVLAQMSENEVMPDDGEICFT